uniref:Uncharacterized protein n=1 Tax=Odontella aurita TaxID=265563 RepID=A0A7S4IX03_9STRA|mmetsp:Transcript_31778/g.95143  ORF Transcript_31778/g.95143 Transcript_31778/m.95143 type:complete len:343 (+) Transcript_31778:222-1250(+)
MFKTSERIDRPTYVSTTMRRLGHRVIFAMLLSACISLHISGAVIDATFLCNKYDVPGLQTAGFAKPGKQCLALTPTQRVDCADPLHAIIGRDMSTKWIASASTRSSLRAFGGGDAPSGEDTFSTVDRVRVLSYRICLILASLGYAGVAIDTFLVGAGNIGLSGDAITAFGVTASHLAGWMAGASALLAPRGNDEGGIGVASEAEASGGGAEIAALIIDSALPIAAALALIVQIIVVFFNTESGIPSYLGDLSSELSSASIALVCAREMVYFGVSYKAEAAIALLLLFLEPTLGGTETPLALSACLALSLLVLSVAKIFEPIIEDLRPGGSRFFATEMTERDK